MKEKNQFLTLLYPCNSNHPVSYRCWAVFGIERIKFKRDILSIDNIRTLNGRIVFSLLFRLLLNWSNRFRIPGFSRMMACVFLYIVLPRALHFTKMYSALSGNLIDF